jgi:S-formylglutathione hydrolase
MSFEKIGESLCFGGQQLRFRHRSSSLGCDMQFSVYLPPAATQQAVPVLYWLSGLTCTDENFVHKAGAQRYAAEHGIAIVAPDTSPRGDGVPDDPDAAWDFGLGAGFYLNATQEPWRKHYQMYEYVLNELPSRVVSNLPVLSNSASIAGHSMGGHGALVLALRNATRYRSVSAFAPIVAPSECPWGQKALGHYLGADRSDWQAYDSCALIAASAPQLPMLVDQGTADSFIREQLRTPRLIETCIAASYPATIRMQAGYDHSYHFVATFIEEHIAFHAEHLYG